MTKDQRTIKLLTTKVEDLSAQLKDANYWKDYYSKELAQARKDTNQVHATLTLMGIPKDDLDLSSRLVLLMTKIGLNSVIKLQAKTDDDAGF